ncbi:MAG: hypothetical protein NT075_13090 [Chloroflexi bacterium]|nr:hypothetical protein [Chloroflexota bacterium]
MNTSTRVLSTLFNRLTLLLFTLVAFALRVWALDAKGLSYDEAATALMARATPLEIIQFHWHASFEHPPFWQLLMHFWSNMAGQREFALRLLPALAGTLLVPLIWQLVKRLEIGFTPQSPISNLQLLPSLTTLLVLTSPVLLLYSQEARMYTIVVALALTSLVAGQQWLIKPTRRGLLVFLLINWAMLGFHYYSVLLLTGEFLAFGLITLRQPIVAKRLGLFLLGMGLTVLPLLLWMAFAPGFRITAQIVLQGVGGGQPSLWPFLDGLWRDFSFGAIRWQPAQATLGYLLLPLALIGLAYSLFLAGRRAPNAPSAFPTPRPALANPWVWLPLFVVLTPILFSALLFRTLATRYILFVMPLLYLLIAVGITWLWQRQRWLGIAALGLVGFVAVVGIRYYFNPYQKSEYRQMAAFLTRHIVTDEAVLLEAPRQHLLAKYYLPTTLPIYTAPTVVLPAYWPISAPPVVPEQMDGQLQSALRKHSGLWLVLTAEDEVDPGEFVSKYLTAIAYKEDCQAWLDVQLCYFASTHFGHLNVTTKMAALWSNELALESAHVMVTRAGISGLQTLLAQLDWRAAVKPTVDYRVTLRLVDADNHVVSQRDDYPIGPLLPPSTWNAGDEKPGFMALPIPATLTAGVYRLTVDLYDPATTTLLTYTQGATASSAPLVLALVEIGDTIVVRKPE